MADSLAEFLRKPAPENPMVIGRGLLPLHGKLVLGGAPKSNKSFLALNVGLNLARGEHIFRATYPSGVPVLPVHRAYRVLYIEQEVGETGLQKRLRGMLGDATPELPLFIKTRDTKMRLDTPEGRVTIASEIRDVRPDVVIFDPLAKLHLADENSSQEIGAICRVFDHFIEDYGITVCFVHHTAKSNPMSPRRGGDKLRGSSAIFADVDSFVEVINTSGPSAKEPILRLNAELRYGEPLDPMFLHRRRSGLMEFVGHTAAERRSRGSERYDDL